jgi:hypothetical protein
MMGQSDWDRFVYVVLLFTMGVRRHRQQQEDPTVVVT